ncbi:hypothetical protein [Chryseobacterium sp.]|uniref:hypothetical protein n=1 Tax=Chryseobacterium sp. TaxID=1871047 RepID=UPI00289AE344|nr:hypothetical protein [Chryseobacterium sp.]
MKKILLIFGIFTSAIFFAQKSQNYYQIAYNSICCGPPSTAPVLNYIDAFQAKNKSKNIEIFRQSGLGREGEFKLFVGIECISKSKRKKFVSGLEAAVNQQNATKDNGSQGNVDFSSTETITKDALTKLPNLTANTKKDIIKKKIK